MKRFAALLPFICGPLFGQDFAEPKRATPDMTLLREAPRWVDHGVPQESSFAAPELTSESLDEVEKQEALREIPEEDSEDSAETSST